jgi:hypothetical protein
MLENIYNIFMFYDGDVCKEVGYKASKLIGDDNKKINFLRKNIENDLNNCSRFKLSKEITRDEVYAWSRLNENSPAIIEAFRKFGIFDSSLKVITPVVNGEIFYDVSIPYGKNTLEESKKQMNIEGEQKDWLIHYTNENGIDISQLIHDDYFEAIKLTYNNKMYVSSMKLLVSCIDSIAYIEFGTGSPFKEWLKVYADLDTLGITPDELWELRNSLLHMTNLNSRQVMQNKIRRISFFAASDENSFFHEVEKTYYFNLYGLIKVYAAALGRWIESYNEDRDKFAKFVERYDQTISDSRISYVKKAP